MNICFVANYTKTFFFDAIAEKLIQKGASIYWIVVNEGNYSFLTDKYPTSNILYLPKDKVLEQKQSAVADFKLNELIYGDRVLKYDYHTGLSFLSWIQKPVEDFISKNKISNLFGEITWAHEIVIYRMSERLAHLNSTYLNIQTTRIPSGRFTFFKNEFQEHFLISEPNFAQLTLPENAFELKKPEYLALNDQIVKQRASAKGRLNRIKAFATGKNLDKNDITLFPSKSKQRTIVPIINELNKETYKRVKTIDYQFLEGKNFILATLHKQPEASIDVFGRYLEDQTRMIIDLWRILPPDWILVVKEHSNAIGDRSFKWFKNLSQYNNIVFAHEKLDSYILIDMCKAVYTISGTIAYEAVLKHKPALVLVNMFFQFPHLKKIDTELLRNCKNINDILDQIPDKTIDEELIKKKIYFNSFPGIIGDPLNNPACMDEQNIENITSAILKVVQ